MATTIKSTELDFNSIKNSLKLYLAQQDEFADYNFEGSALSNILDVLAYNTHYNGLLANFALNESFLSTAQLRSSLVGLSGGLGYSVGSRSASFAVVNMFVTNPEAPTTMTMPAGFSFSTKIDNVSYTFKTRNTLTAYNNGDNQYFFGLDENLNVSIHEGVTKNKIFIAGSSNENDTYVIPVSNIDLNTVIVRVYDDPASSNYNLYTNVNDATTINSNSRIYVIKESPNGYYELTFGAGVRLGLTPDVGSKIEVIYDITSGPEANGARTFTPNSTLDGLNVNVVTISTSAGGSYKEEIDSIRKNAPYQYATQNRMVTAEDYASLILRKYSNLIDDIKAWGGEDNIPPKYGTVFVSIDPTTSDETIVGQLKDNIRDLVRDFSVVSFDVEFTDPEITYLEVTTRFQFNPSLTSSSQTQIETNVKSAIVNYFSENLGGFDQSYRRSNMLTVVDGVDEAVLSSRAQVKMQKRFVPQSGVTQYSINFPTSIVAPDDENYSVESGDFLLNGVKCFFRNRLNTSTIEVINVSTGGVQVDNIGQFESSTGVLTLSGFEGTLVTGDHIKITATPANESVINPVRNNILEIDETATRSVAVLTDTV